MSDVKRVGGAPPQATIQSKLNEAQSKGLLRNALPQFLRDAIDYQAEAQKRGGLREVRAQRLAQAREAAAAKLAPPVERDNE